MHDLVARVAQIQTQVMMQNRANASIAQKSNVVPVEIMRNEALWRFSHAMQGAEYRDIATAHRVHRCDGLFSADGFSHALLGQGVEPMAATGVYQGQFRITRAQFVAKAVFTIFLAPEA